MLPLSPVCADTKVSLEANEWLPASFNDFLTELKNIRESALSNGNDSLLLFRGHRDRTWVLDSTFARCLQETLFGLKPGSERLSAFIKESSDFHNAVTAPYLLKFGTLVAPSQELETAAMEHGVDAWFELCRRLQQYPSDDSPTLRGSNFFDWSQSADIALYFANEDRIGEGAVYVLDATATGKTLQTKSMAHVLQLMADRLKDGEAMGAPLLFSPVKQLSYVREKNQQAIYIAQMDLRFELEYVWNLLARQLNRLIYVKLILPEGTNAETSVYLAQKGIIKSFVYPDD